MCNHRINLFKTTIRRSKSQSVLGPLASLTFLEKGPHNVALQQFNKYWQRTRDT